LTVKHHSGQAVPRSLARLIDRKKLFDHCSTLHKSGDKGTKRENYNANIIIG